MEELVVPQIPVLIILVKLQELYHGGIGSWRGTLYGLQWETNNGQTKTNIPWESDI